MTAAVLVLFLRAARGNNELRQEIKRLQEDREALLLRVWMMEMPFRLREYSATLRICARGSPLDGGWDASRVIFVFGCLGAGNSTPGSAWFGRSEVLSASLVMPEDIARTAILAAWRDAAQQGALSLTPPRPRQPRQQLLLTNTTPYNDRIAATTTCPSPTAAPRGTSLSVIAATVTPSLNISSAAAPRRQLPPSPARTAQPGGDENNGHAVKAEEKVQNENENQNENADEVASEAGSMDSAGKEPGSSEALHEQHRSSSDAPESLSSGDRSQRSRRREESVSGIAAGLESGGDESSDDEEADIEMGTLVPSGYRPVGKEEDALCTWSLADIDLDADLGTFSSGTFGTVVGGRVGNGSMIAMKIVDQPDFNKSESEILHECSVHPNVVDLLGVLEFDSVVSLIMPMASSCLAYTMKNASPTIMVRQLKQLVAALGFLHSRNIVHHDVKPANVLVQDGEVLLADFGLAARFPDDGLVGFCGTQLYMAPELFQNVRHKGEVDMWAVGVIAYKYIHQGLLPFNGSKDAESLGSRRDISPGTLAHEIVRGSYMMGDGIPDLARDFVGKLLRVDMSTRMTAASALRHPWLGPSTLFRQGITRRLAEECSRRRAARMAAAVATVRCASDDAVEAMLRAQDSSGMDILPMALSSLAYGNDTARTALVFIAGIMVKIEEMVARILEIQALCCGHQTGSTPATTNDAARVGSRRPPTASEKEEAVGRAEACADEATRLADAARAAAFSVRGTNLTDCRAR